MISVIKVVACAEKREPCVSLKIVSVQLWILLDY